MRSALRILLAGLALAGPLAIVHATASAADAPAGFATAVVLDDLNAGDGGIPVAFAYAPDGRIFVARKDGVVDVYDDGVVHVFLDIQSEVNDYQSRGMLGLAVDPDFATNHEIYVMFTAELHPDDPDQIAPAGGEIVNYTQSTIDPDTADVSTRVTLLSGYNAVAPQHEIGALHFDAQGNLLATLGDASNLGVNNGQALAAEDPDDLRGKLLRIDPTTGLGVPGNPYYDAAAPGSVRSKVYARGLRNAYRFSVDPDNGTLYVGNVGWATWEALDAFPTTFTDADHDRNAGWPCYEGGDGVALPQPDFEYSPVTQAACQAIYSPADGGTGAGALAPLYAYRHDEPGADNGSAITAGPKYTATSNYPSQYDDQIFIADWGRDRFQTVDPTTGVATDFGTAGTWGKPVDIEVAPDGNIAYLALGTDELREIVYSGVDHPPVAVATARPRSSPTAPFTVHLHGSRSRDADPGDTLTYDWNYADGSPDGHTPNALHRYANAGSYDVTLTVSDGHPGGTDTASLWIDVANTPPTVALTSPTPSYHYKIGDNIALQLDGEDAEDGPLTGTALSTQVWLVDGVDAMQPVVDFTGTSASFTATDAGADTAFYEVATTATDSFGRTTTKTFDIRPARRNVTITSRPPGATVTVDGTQATAPTTFSSIVGEHHEVSAPADFVSSGSDLAFDSWTQGATLTNSQTDDFVTPRGGTTVVANYVPTTQGLSVANASITEGKNGSRSVAVAVSLSTPMTAPVSVDYSTADGSATAPSDYTAASGTLTFAPGETTRELDVGVNGDQAVEPAEQFQVGLSNPHGASIVSGIGTVTILNDDPGRGRVLAVGDVTTLEGDAGSHDALVTVALAAASPTPVSVDYATSDGTATAPSDYAAVSGTLTFAPGVTASVVAVPIVGDGAFEPSEAFTFGLSNAVGAPITRATATVRITNDDPGPALSIGDVATVEGNSGDRAAFVTVTLSTPSTSLVTVDWAVTHVTTNDGDVKRKTGMLTFAPGALVATTQVAAFADTDVEPDETYLVTLSDPVNATIANGTATGTILNDDPSTGLNVGVGDAAITEGNSGTRRLRFTVDLSDPAPGAVSVDYTTASASATAGSDFTTVHGTVTFRAGDTTSTFSVVVLSDAIAEPTETFTISLSNATGGATIGRAVGTATILDDD